MCVFEIQHNIFELFLLTNFTAKLTTKVVFQDKTYLN